MTIWLKFMEKKVILLLNLSVLLFVQNGQDFLKWLMNLGTLICLLKWKKLRETYFSEIAITCEISEVKYSNTGSRKCSSLWKT